MRRLLKSWKFWLGGLALAGLFAGATLPWWFAWTAQWLLRGQGISVSEWQVEGWSHYQLSGIELDLDAGTGELEQIRMVQPWSWSLRVLRDRADPQAEPSLLIRGLVWHQAEGDSESSPEPIPGVTAIYELLEELQPTLHRWVPHLRVEDSVIHAGETLVELPLLVWQDGHLELDLAYPAAGLTAQLSGALQGPWRLKAQTPFFPDDLVLTLQPSRQAEQLELIWTVNWRPLSASGEVQFRGSDTTPVFGDGEWLLDGLQGADFGLPQLRDVSGTLEFEWRNERWRAKAKLEGAWEEAEHRIPVLLDIDLFGDTERAHFRALEVSAPWVEAKLDAETRFDFERRLFLDPFRFDLIAGLGALEIPGLEGDLRFSVETDPWAGGGDLPGSRFELQADEIRYQNLALRDLSAMGEFLYPDLKLETLQVGFREGTWLQAQLDADLEQRSWNLEHAVLELLHADVQDLIDAEFDWGLLPDSSEWNLASTGSFTENLLADLQLSILSDLMNASVDLEVDWKDPDLHLNIRELELDPESGENLRLASPTVVSLGFPEGPLSWAFDSLLIEGDSGFTLQGRGQGLDATPAELDFELRGFDSRVWKSWLPEAWPAFDLSRIELDWQPDSGDAEGIVARFQADAFVEVEVLQDNQGVYVDIDTYFDSRGFHVERFDWRGQTIPFVSAGGYLPARLRNEDGSLRLRVVEDAEMDLDLKVQSRPVLLSMVEGFTGVELSDPSVHLELAGRFNRPRGQLRVDIDSIRSERFGDALPFELDRIHLDLNLRPEGLFLDPLEFYYLGDTFRATGEMPMRSEDWQALWEERVLPDWSRTQGRLQSQQFRIQALAPLLPELIVPTGTIDIDLRLEPGWNLGGHVELTGASTRPLAIGSGLRDINGRVRFSGDQLEIERFRAYIERHAIELSGGVDFSNLTDPGMNLRLRGNNLPLIRQQEMIIRGDADISLGKEPGAPARISGNLNLRESLVLQDLRGVMRPGVATAAARPPFFSIDAPFVSEWALDLNIRGERFLRVQSPFFRGRISSDLRLLGTLEEPFLNGVLTIPSGSVLFPFGNIRLQQGEVRFAPANPYDPQLDVSGEAETMGFTIRMGVTGSAYDPQLQFSSNPPLSQESIILMLTAGIMPSDDIAASGGAVGQRLALYLGRGLASDLFGGTEESWTRNLEVRSGGGISESGRETYQIEYRLTDGFSIFGENDVFDEYNVGLRWRVFTR